MAADPKEELTEGLKHCLWFRGPVLMDHLITLRHEVNQLNAPPRPATNRVDVKTPPILKAEARAPERGPWNGLMNSSLVHSMS